MHLWKRHKNKLVGLLLAAALCALAVAGAYAALPPAVRRDMLDYLWRFLVNMGTGGKG